MRAIRVKEYFYCKACIPNNTFSRRFEHCGSGTGSTTEKYGEHLIKGKPDPAREPPLPAEVFSSDEAPRLLDVFLRKLPWHDVSVQIRARTGQNNGR